jgi:flagellar motor switch protein FliN
MNSYLDAWISVATTLLSQALAGEPELNESLPKPMATGAFAFAAAISGEQAGRFVVVLDPGLLDTSLVGEGMDQKAGWAEILREVAEAAAGELLAKAGIKCKVESFEEAAAESQVSRAFQLRSNGRAWTILVRDDVRAAEVRPAPPPAAVPDGSAPTPMPGIELLLDVELEASLRFGCREIPLGELLDLGPGDVVELDRHIADPVDLLVGDKIVARGEVVLVNGDFGLRITEVAAPRKRLESIRCLF